MAINLIIQNGVNGASEHKNNTQLLRSSKSGSGALAVILNLQEQKKNYC
jgi:hypothetical protein